MNPTLRDLLADAVEAVPEVREYLSPRALILLPVKSQASYGAVRDEYERKIYDIIHGYLKGAGERYDFAREAMKRAMYGAMIPAFHIGFMDGAGSRQASPSQEDNDWIASKVEGEAGFIGSLFVQLRALKKTPELVAADQARLHAVWYARTLDGVYNEGLLRGMGGAMLTFAGIDGQPPEYPCPECDKLKGKRHRASWWVSHGLVPGQPGNTNFSCGGWQCKHTLVNDSGKQVMLYSGTDTAHALAHHVLSSAPSGLVAGGLVTTAILLDQSQRDQEQEKKKKKVQ